MAECKKAAVDLTNLLVGQAAYGAVLGLVGAGSNRQLYTVVVALIRGLQADTGVDTNCPIHDLADVLDVLGVAT
eukprot:10320496-Prorocentrum_lima.AAC.1